MASEQTFERLSTVMRTLFRNPDVTASPAMTAKDVKGWDSLNHIRFILEVERAFGVKFSTSEIAKFKNVGELAEIVEAKQAAKA